MRVTFDPAKDKANLAKHGVSLQDAIRLEWDEMMAWVDERFDYGEARCVGLAPIEDRLYAVVFVDRPHGNPTERRIISLRKANVREVKHYVQNT